MRPLLAFLWAGFSAQGANGVSGAIVGGHPAQVPVLEPVAVALEADHLGVVDQAVDHGRGHHGVAEHLAPATELLVGGDDDAGPLVAGGHQLKNRLAASASKGM